MIEIKNIKKGYSNNTDSISVLKDISLEIKKGQIVTVYGNSGVGKSTLLSIIVGMLNPDYGKVKIKDMTLNEDNSLNT